MKNLILPLFVLTTAIVSCRQEDPADLSDTDKATKIHYPAGRNDFGLTPDTTGIAKGDPYFISGIRFEGELLIVTVGYPGGCASHGFEVQGELGPVDSDPMQATIAIVHESHGDNCEAWIQEDIRINLKELLGVDRADLLIFNPSQAETKYSFFDYRHIPQGTCELEATFEPAICGTGLYGNNWFRLKDDGTWLQPVSLQFSVDDTILEPGKSYKVAFWNAVWRDPGVVSCLAYPGPSVMAEITCIEKID